jgi:hypothetical protein
MPDGTAPNTTTAAPQPRAPGVYFGLPHADYLADPSLGGTDLKAILVHPACYWQRSWMNPARKDDDTPAKRAGRALHKLVLEGPKAFERAYISEPQPADHPGCLVTLEDLKSFCRDRGEKISGTKAELAKIVKKADPAVTIWDDILGLFRAMVERDRLEILKPDAMAEVQTGAASITLNPHLARAFKGGAAEVSVFWVADGVPLKARYDFLKPRTIIDLKKFANQRQRPVDVAVRMAIAEYRYDISARHYLDGYPHLMAHVRDGRVSGDCPLPAGWERQLAAPNDMKFTWVFHQMEAPVTVGRQIGGDSPVLNRAVREIAHAKRVWLDCMERFGTGMWIGEEPILDLEEADLPMWLREGVEEL